MSDNNHLLDLSIIVVSYNTAELTMIAIESVLASSIPGSFELIVIDNASSDDSAQRLAALADPRVRFIASKVNHGFAKANNIAAEGARGRYILLLNPDTEVGDDSIQNLIEFAKSNPDNPIWGGKTYFQSGELNPTYCWAKMSVWNLALQLVGLTSMFRNSAFFNPEGVGNWNEEAVREVDIVSGCYLLITRDLWIDLAGFDEDFFMYGEEADLCLRAAQVGRKPIVTSNSSIIHHGGASERVPSRKVISLMTAKVRLLRRHLGPVSRYLGVFLLTGWPLSRYLIHAARDSILQRSSPDTDMWKTVWEQRRDWL